MHWILVWNRIETLISDPKYSLICCCINLSYNFDKLDKILTGIYLFIYLLISCSYSCSYQFHLFLYTGTTSEHVSSFGKKSLSKHLLKCLARKPWNMLLNSLIILSGISLDFEAFLDCNHLIAVDICSLSTFLKVKVEYKTVHFSFNSKYTWLVIVS